MKGSRMESVPRLTHRSFALALVLAWWAGAASAATGTATATATVVDQAFVESTTVRGVFDRSFPSLLVPPSFDAAVPERTIPLGAGALGPGNMQPAGGALVGPAGAPGGGSVQTVQNADGSVSLNISGGASVAHVITRTPDGQLHVDFN